MAGKLKGFLRKRKNSTVWYCQTWVNGKAWARSTGETDRRRAEARVAQLRDLAQRLNARQGASLRLSQAIVFEVARIESDVSRQQADRNSFCLTNFLKWAGDVQLVDIDDAMVENYQQYRLKQVAHQTVQKEICAILKMMQENGIQLGRPSRKPGKRTEQRNLTADELKRFFEHCPETWRPLFLLMPVTGARPAELVPSKRSAHKPLLKDEIDAETGIVTIRSAKVLPGKKPRVLRVAVPKAVLDLVLKATKSTKGDFAFSLTQNLCRSFDRIIKAAGIRKSDAAGRKVTAHSFRHTYATIMAESAAVNYNPFILKEILGHSQITTTDRYCHPTAPEVRLDLSALMSCSEDGKNLAGVSEKNTLAGVKAGPVPAASAPQSEGSILRVVGELVEGRRRSTGDSDATYDATPTKNAPDMGA